MRRAELVADVREAGRALDCGEKNLAKALLFGHNDLGI